MELENLSLTELLLLHQYCQKMAKNKEGTPVLIGDELSPLRVFYEKYEELALLIEYELNFRTGILLPTQTDRHLHS